MFGLWLADKFYSGSLSAGIGWRGFIRRPHYLTVLIFGLLNLLAMVLSITPEMSFWGSWMRNQGLLTIISWILFFSITAEYIRSRIHNAGVDVAELFKGEQVSRML